MIDYELTEADVRRYRRCGRARACGRYCSRSPGSILLMAALGATLAGLCSMGHGRRAGLTAVGATLAVLAAFAALVDRGADRRLRRMARDLGVPCRVRLDVSARGIAQEPGPEPDDPGRVFAWPEVVEVARLDGLTVVRLRSARGVLLIPDRAFSGPGAREAFVRQAEDFRASAARG